MPKKDYKVRLAIGHKYSFADVDVLREAYTDPRQEIKRGIQRRNHIAVTTASFRRLKAAFKKAGESALLFKQQVEKAYDNAK